MKKAIAREFLWFILTLILAVPLALLFMWLVGFTTENVARVELEKDYIARLFIVGFVVSVVGVYLLRLIVAAARTLAKRPDNSDAKP